jgi:hypothetical protein
MKYIFIPIYYFIEALVHLFWGIIYYLIDFKKYPTIAEIGGYGTRNEHYRNPFKWMWKQIKELYAR